MTMTSKQIERLETMYRKLEICERHLKNCGFSAEEIADGFLAFSFIICENQYGVDKTAALLEAGTASMRSKVAK